MSIKISQLSSVSEVLGTDESPVVQSSATKKFSMSQLGSYILNSFSSLSLGGVTQTVKSAIDAIATLLGSSPMGTTATTVTGAIAEHESDISSLNSSLIIVSEFTSESVTLNAGELTTISVPCSVAGYTLLGVVGLTMTSTEVIAIHRFYQNSAGTAVFITLKNTHSEARTFTVRVRGIYKKA